MKRTPQAGMHTRCACHSAMPAKQQASCSMWAPTRRAHPALKARSTRSSHPCPAPHLRASHVSSPSVSRTFSSTFISARVRPSSASVAVCRHLQVRAPQAPLVSKAAT